MSATTTTLSAITKTFYVQNEVVNQINAQSVLFDKLLKGQETDVSGKSYTYAIRTSRNRYAARGISEGGDYGTVGSQGTENVVVPNAELVTPIELSSRVINAATGANKGAFISALKMEVEYGMKDMIRAINRQLHSDGTDALAFWTGADNSSGTDVDDGQGNAFPVHLEGGATRCDLIDASDHATKVGDSIVVTLGAEGADDVAVTWTGSVSGSADGDYLVLEDTLGKAMMGIRGVIAGGNPPLLAGGLHGLAVASHSYWKAQVFDNNGTQRDLTLSLMQKPLTQIGVRSAATEADVKFLLGNGFVKNKFIDLLIADQRHVNETVLKGGQTAVDFNGKPFIVDPQCRRNTIYYINPSSMDVLSATKGIGWADFDGDQWVKKVGISGYAAAYQAFLTFEGNLACKNRAGNAVLTDLVDA